MNNPNLHLSISAGSDQSGPSRVAETIALHDILRQHVAVTSHKNPGTQDVMSFVAVILAAPVLVEVAKGFWQYLSTRPAGKITITYGDSTNEVGGVTKTTTVAIEGITKPTSAAIEDILRELLANRQL